MKINKFNTTHMALRECAAYLKTMLPKQLMGLDVYLIVDYAPVPDAMNVSLVLNNEGAFSEVLCQVPLVDNMVCVPGNAPRYIRQIVKRRFPEWASWIKSVQCMSKFKKDVHWSDVLKQDSPFLKKCGDDMSPDGWLAAITIDEIHEADFIEVNSVYGKAIDSNGMKHCIPPLSTGLTEDMLNNLDNTPLLARSGKTMTVEHLMAEKGLEFVSLKNRTPSQDPKIFPQGTWLEDKIDGGFEKGQLAVVAVPPPIHKRNLDWIMQSQSYRKGSQEIDQLPPKPTTGVLIIIDDIEFYVGRELGNNEYLCRTASGEAAIIREEKGDFKHVGGVERDVNTRIRTIVYFDGTTKQL